MRVDSHPHTFVWLLTACTSLLNSVFPLIPVIVAETSGTETLQRVLFHKLKCINYKACSKGICQLYAWYSGGTVIETKEERRTAYKMD